MKIVDTLAEIGESRILIAQGQMELSRDLAKWVDAKLTRIASFFARKPALATIRESRN